MDKSGRFALGFATFFLNRTNHSGILNGGMIGGRKQKGPYRIDARFNRPELRRRIERIGCFRDRINLSCEDGMEFLSKNRYTNKCLVYLDPPYYRSGKRLYLNAYCPEDHADVSDTVLKLSCPWIVSYDDVPEIRDLYKSVRFKKIRLNHTASSSELGRRFCSSHPYCGFIPVTGHHMSSRSSEDSTNSTGWV